MKNASFTLTKIPSRSLSLIVSLFVWAMFSALTVFIILGMKDRARLIQDNENEQIFNMLFTSLRNHEDFGSAIEETPVLKERIRSFAIYNNDLAPVYSLGKVPPTFDENLLEGSAIQGSFGRFTIPRRKDNSVIFILRADGLQMPPSPPTPMNSERQPRRMTRSSNTEEQSERMMMPSASSERRSERMQIRIIERQGFPFFNTLARGRYYYFEIFHPVYWRTVTLYNILLPLCCAALLGMVFYIRHLYLRNLEYRERIEAQKSLVVLGTATGTLAHEIKTPLSSIRLQTGILEKIYAQGSEELSIINEEVDRLSALSRRVNDYLKEGSGDAQVLNLYEIVFEAGMRLCGRNIIPEDSLREAIVFADVERMRSVFENLIRNALESGGAAGDVEAIIEKTTGSIIVHVLDRGKGIAEEDMGRIFDLFFTRKSSGTGIGLAVCKRFVEAAGGSISINNRSTEGDKASGGAEAVVLFPEYQTEKGQI